MGTSPGGNRERDLTHTFIRGFQVEGVKLVVELGENLAGAARSTDGVEDLLLFAEQTFDAEAGWRASPGAPIYLPSRRDSRDSAPVENFFASLKKGVVSYPSRYWPRRRPGSLSISV